MSSELITPSALASRLEREEPLVVLDIRDDPSWPIVGPFLASVHGSAQRVLADPAAAAAELDGSVVVVCNRGIKAEPVARALRAQGVDAAFLQHGMRGWIGALRAYPVELGVPGLELRQVQRPARGCLSYVAASGGEALVVDPAPDAEFYAAVAADLGAEVTQVFDTHLHADHVSGARALAELTGASLRLPAAALDRGVAYADAVAPVADGESIGFGGAVARAVALPGHTSDMTGLLIAERALIGGDSVFADGIARPDLQRGDPEGARAMARTLHATIAERVHGLDDDVLLLPGHTHPGARAEALAPPLARVRAEVPELALADPAEFADALLAEMPPRPANYETIIAVNSGEHPVDLELETGGNSCSTR